MLNYNSILPCEDCCVVGWNYFTVSAALFYISLFGFILYTMDLERKTIVTVSEHRARKALDGIKRE